MGWVDAEKHMDPFLVSHGMTTIYFADMITPEPAKYLLTPQACLDESHFISKLRKSIEVGLLSHQKAHYGRLRSQLKVFPKAVQIQKHPSYDVHNGSDIQ